MDILDEVYQMELHNWNFDRQFHHMQFSK